VLCAYCYKQGALCPKRGETSGWFEANRRSNDVEWLIWRHMAHFGVTWAMWRQMSHVTWRRNEPCHVTHFCVASLSCGIPHFCGKNMSYCVTWFPSRDKTGKSWFLCDAHHFYVAFISVWHLSFLCVTWFPSRDKTRNSSFLCDTHHFCVTLISVWHSSFLCHIHFYASHDSRHVTNPVTHNFCVTLIISISHSFLCDAHHFCVTLITKR